MKKEYRPAIIKIIIILFAAAILFGLSAQSSQALAADNTNPAMQSSVNGETAQYQVIQLAGQVIALFLGAGFILLALAPFISSSEKDQMGRSDIRHYSKASL